MNEANKKFGALLKLERERQNITIEDIAEKLKIVQANLEAIEEGEAAKLPSELYFNLFSKTYAEALGIDYTRTMEAIKDEFNGVTENKEKQPVNNTEVTDTETEDPDSTRAMIKKMSYFGGGILVVFILFLLINHFFFKSSEPQNSDSTTEQETVKQKDNDMLAEYSNYDWEKREYHVPKKIKLTLMPREESWSTVLADGDTVIYRTLRVGRTYTAEADHRLLVSIGIPSVVKTLLNEKEVNLRNPESKRISRVLINQLNLDSFLAPPKTDVDTPPVKAAANPVPTGTSNIQEKTENDTLKTSSLEIDEE